MADTINFLIEQFTRDTCLRCTLPDCVGQGGPGCKLVNIEREAAREYWRLRKAHNKSDLEERRGYHPQIHGPLELPKKPKAKPVPPSRQPGYKAKLWQQHKADRAARRGYWPEIHGPLN